MIHKDFVLQIRKKSTKHKKEPIKESKKDPRAITIQ